jgi:Rrf2 family protein
MKPGTAILVMLVPDGAAALPGTVEVVMKLTRASSYALQAVTFLAQQKKPKAVASHDIAEARNIPGRFLLKVLTSLVEIKVLESIKGPHGGYKLARPADEITMLEIIEAVDGDIKGINPVTERGSPAMNGRLEAVCKQTAEAVRNHLDTVRISDLIGKKGSGDGKARKTN